MSSSIPSDHLMHIVTNAGLYNMDRGPHNFWLTSNKNAQGRPDAIVNLLHYDDAAGACIAALFRGMQSLQQVQNGEESIQGKVMLISDGNPTTRYGLCESAKKSSRFSSCVIPKFLGGVDDARGKVYDGSWSNVMLHWTPRYSSFDSFMVSSTSL